MNFRNDVASFSFAINNIYVPRIIKFINEAESLIKEIEQQKLK
ncbi:MAG: hypothetical protein P8I51_03430 [Polaribacter sp.]|jgi:hypothetical protein|nr:hypothetical protein [Polaribacter sp.]MDG1953928.1 hypothetical protein [Polaribacter sp.]